jgi:hypothetical protein
MGDEWPGNSQTGPTAVALGGPGGDVRRCIDLFPPFLRFSMRFRRFLLALALVAIPARAAAQNDTTPPPSRPAEAAAVTEAELQLSTRLLDLMDMRGSAAAGVRMMLDTQLLANPELAPYRPILEEWARELFASQAATDAYARMYAERFTEGELRELVAFSESPTGRRAASEQQGLIRAGEEIGRQLATAAQDDLVARLQKAMEESPPAPKSN